MFCICMAGIVIELDNRYAYVEHLCRDYTVSSNTMKAEFRVHVTEAEIKAYISSCGRPMTAPESESYLLYRRICEQMPLYDGILLHAAAIAMEGRGYLFSAPRGTGKSTHTNLWASHFAHRVIILNGDKPIIRRASDGYFWIYGTPWCGKEGLHSNARAPLSALCFLEQSAENRILPASVADTTVRLLEATLLPTMVTAQDRMATLVGEIIRKTPAYILSCRPERTAAEIAYEFLSRV